MKSMPLINTRDTSKDRKLRKSAVTLTQNQKDNMLRKLVLLQSKIKSPRSFNFSDFF
ncbi:hypothetical protein CMALT394_540002 [Carnobacterium maltaromaticum]|nr:hypothetical protein CMALT394_540002 [Carnobacterium maltaromaticum]